MKVYIIMKHCRKDFSNIYGIYFTKEKVKNIFKDLIDTEENIYELVEDKII